MLSRRLLYILILINGENFFIETERFDLLHRTFTIFRKSNYSELLKFLNRCLIRTGRWKFFSVSVEINWLQTNLDICPFQLETAKSLQFRRLNFVCPLKSWLNWSRRIISCAFIHLRTIYKNYVELLNASESRLVFVETFVNHRRK